MLGIVFNILVIAGIGLVAVTMRWLGPEFAAGVVAGCALYALTLRLHEGEYR